MATCGSPLGSWTASQSGWARATSDSAAARNGASQIPGVRPSAAMAAASPSIGVGKSSFVRSQSPMAGWKPSSSWNTSKGHSAAAARLARRSASVTPWK